MLETTLHVGAVAPEVCTGSCMFKATPHPVCWGGVGGLLYHIRGLSISGAAGFSLKLLPESEEPPFPGPDAEGGSKDSQSTLGTQRHQEVELGITSR